MKKRVLDIGNCSLDHSAIRSLIEGRFEAEVTQAHGWTDASKVLEQTSYDLILVNRVLDRDGGDGLEIVRQIKSDAKLKETPVMLITNFDEHQQRAAAAGAARGFGKQAIRDPRTLETLRAVLG